MNNGINNNNNNNTSGGCGEKQQILNSSGGSGGLGAWRLDSFNKKLKIKTSFLNNLSGTMSTKANATGGQSQLEGSLQESKHLRNLLSTSLQLANNNSCSYGNLNNVSGKSKTILKTSFE